MSDSRNGSNFNPTYQTTSQDVQDCIQVRNCGTELYEESAIIIINLILSLVGTCGNVLIIFAVSKTPHLRQRSFNLLLLSLAIVDLLVTMVAQPLHAASMCFKTYHHLCVSEIDLAYDVTGNFSVFCSMFHLSAISIDRAISTIKPHKYQDVMKRRGLKIMLTTCWGTALVFACVRVLFAGAMIISIGLIVINYGIILAAYFAVLYKIRLTKSNPNNLAPGSTNTARNTLMEKRVSITVLIVIVCFSICVLPGFGFYIYIGSAKIRDIGSAVYMWIRTLALSGSSMNFIIYSCRINHFRMAYLNIMRNIMRNPSQIHVTDQPTSQPDSQPVANHSQSVN